MIPAHLLDFVQSISFHLTVHPTVTVDGGAEGVSTYFPTSDQRRTEALGRASLSSHYTGYEGYLRERIQLGRTSLRN